MVAALCAPTMLFEDTVSPMISGLVVKETVFVESDTVAPYSPITSGEYVTFEESTMSSS